MIPRSGKALFLGLIGTILCLVELFFLKGWEKDFSEIEVSRLRNEVQFILPLLRQRLDPWVLMQEGLIHSLQGAIPMGTPTAKLVSHRLDEIFGGRAEYAFWNPDGELVLSKGLSCAELDSIRFILDFKAFRTPPASDSEEIYMESLRTIIRGSFGERLGRPSVNTFRTSFHGSENLVAWGTFLTPLDAPSDFAIDEKHSLEEARQRLGVNLGKFAIFIPEAVANDREWFLRNLPQNRTLFPISFWVGSRSALRGGSALPPKLAEAVLDQGTDSLAGEFVIRDGGGAFVSMGVDSDQIFVAWREFPQNVDPLESTPFLILYLAVIGASLSLLRKGGLVGEGWKTPILSKFSQISLGTILFPLIGLLCVFVQWSSWNMHSLILKRFLEMEGICGSVESLREKTQGDRVALMKQLIMSSRWKSRKNQPADIDSLQKEMGRVQMNDLFVLPRNSSPIHREVFKDYSNRERTSVKTIPIFINFLAKLSATFKLDQRGKPNLGASLRDGVSGDMVYDILAKTLPPGTFYKLLLLQGRIVPMAIMHEAIWAYFNLSYSSTFEPLMAFLAIFRSKLVDDIEVLNFLGGNQKVNFGVPEVSFLSSVFESFQAIHPRWMELQPGFQTLQRTLCKEEGELRGTTVINGKRFLFLIRPLVGFHYGAAILRPHPEEDPVSLGELVANASVVYPLAVAVGMILLFHRFFLDPVVKLNEGVRAIAGGSYSTQLPVTTNDEIGEACQAFNKMADSLREMEFLQRFLSDLTREAISSGRETRATRIPATVMCTDIRGFTTLSETHDPEVIVGMLNSYFTRMEQVIEKHGGKIEKFIGDAILAVFLPVHGRAPSPERAVGAAWEMRGALGEFNAERTREGLFTIQTGIGIGTGETLLASLGGKGERQDFTVTGATVNLATRMEKASKKAKGKGIVLCPETSAAVGELYRLGPLPYEGIESREVMDIRRGGI